MPRESRGVILLPHVQPERTRGTRPFDLRKTLLQCGFAIAELGILAAEEELPDPDRIDDAVVADRIDFTAQWLASEPRTWRLACGCFGSGEAAAAAVAAAARQGTTIQALVIHGGRPHRAEPALSSVRAATLLLCGSEDQEILESCAQAAARLGGEHQFVIIPEASDEQTETARWNEVCRETVRWFNRHLPPPGATWL